MGTAILPEMAPRVFPAAGASFQPAPSEDNLSKIVCQHRP